MAFGKLFFVRSLACLAAAASLCLAPASARAQQAIATPVLPSASNFRDLAGISAAYGGTGFSNPTTNFGAMRTGVVYRSDELGMLTPSDLTTISSLGIGRDIDLRTPAEIAQAPDVVPRGALYTNINIYGTPSVTPLPFAAPLPAAVASMTAIYRGFVTDPTERAGFRAVLLTLATDPFADLYHCSGGKDRTGWTSAILESIAGVAPATILRDYLATNTYTAATIRSTKATLMAQIPGADPATLDALLGVLPAYLQASLDQVAASYGSMANYLIQGLGLSPADIYVLRARMVNYLTLPGQAGASGNAASGAALLNALQNSPLSGRYTAFNFYLQSAVDAGTLGGVQAQAGGQVYADAASYLVRQAQRVAEAVAPYTAGRDLAPGQARLWLAGFGGNFRSDAASGAAASSEYGAGSVAGATFRLGDKASASLGLGTTWGSVESAGARATVGTVLGTAAGRYGFSGLDAGPFAAADVLAGWVDTQSRRDLSGGLGGATGVTSGAVYSGRAQLGWVAPLSGVTLTPRAGVRVTGASLAGFKESGGELALNVRGMTPASASLLADLDLDLAPWRLGTWTVDPALTLGYERLLGDPRTSAAGSLFGIGVSQRSAFAVSDLWKAGLGLKARNGAFSLEARVSAMVGDAAASAGLGGQVSLGYSF